MSNLHDIRGKKLASRADLKVAFPHLPNSINGLKKLEVKFGFPAAIRLSTNVRVWDLEAVEKFVADRIREAEERHAANLAAISAKKKVRK